MIEALGVSCLLLQELLNDTALGSTNPSPEAWEEFQNIIDQERYKKFLRDERVLLRSAGLTTEVSNDIVKEMERVVKTLVENRTILKDDWPSRLARLGAAVCDAERATLSQRRRWLLLRPAKRAAGAGLILLINNAPRMLGHPIADLAWLASLSVQGGVALISSAAEAVV